MSPREDREEAARWYRIAAEQGHPDAQALIGVMHYSGQGVPQYYKEAARWYAQAAGQGNAFAQSILGLMYKMGQGVPQSYAEAHIWLSLAASCAKGEDQNQFANARKCVAARMTPQQIEEAQRLAREWTPVTKGQK